MATLIKTYKLIRRNWKKSAIVAVVVAYGVQYTKGYFETREMMRAYCEEARKYGEMCSSLDVGVRHVTILLNPGARDGKCRSVFDKYCGPLLYLSGCRVAIVKTEHEGQAKELMEIMDNTDAVIIAGGDGTLSEAVTGLLRRADREEAVRRLPIATLPLGKTNSVARRLFGADGDEVRTMAEATMAAIKGTKRLLDVMEIQSLEDGEINSRPVYAMTEMMWGAFRDVRERVPRYWYWGRLREYVAYIFILYKEVTWSCDADMEYTLPCDGCSKCITEAYSTPPQSTTGRHWWHSFIPSQQRQPTVAGIDYSHVHNPECSVWHSYPLHTADLQVTTCNTERPEGSLHVTVGPADLSWWQFLMEGWRRAKTGARTTVNSFPVRSLRLRPRLEKEKAHVQQWFSIDNEKFEVKSVQLSILPKKVHMFVNEPRG